MSDESGVHHPIGRYTYQACLAMYVHAQSKQVRFLTEGHVCASQ